jgi:ABC-type branched-subunit amino acid transport system substrate-binding protein
MKYPRLCGIITISFLIVLLAGCAQMAKVGKLISGSAPAPREQVAKAEPAAGQETAKPADMKPAETKKPQAATPETRPQVGPGEIKPAPMKPVEIPPETGKPLPPPAVAVNRNAVGCILPLSGRFAEAGNKALDAILLSAETFNQRYSTPWKIVIADSGEANDGMQKAVTYLAEQAQVMAIIAVAGSSEAMDAALEAEKRKVPLILITSREGVTGGRDYVFQHFLTPTQQMQALARYAIDRMNVAIFSILYPQDDYGEEMTRLFRQEIQKVGGKVNRAVSYSKTQTDFSEQIGKLTGQKLETSDKSYGSQQDAKARMFVDFEALFIPDSHLRLKMITSQLAFYDVKGFKLLGTSLWHSPDLLKKGSEYLEGAVFADSFLANGFLPETNDFVDIYYSAYSREPENIDALSYDTMEIVLGILEDEKVKTRDDFIRSLLAIDRFQGATGSVYFRGNHVAQKSAFMIKIQTGKLGQVK